MSEQGPISGTQKQVAWEYWQLGGLETQMKTLPIVMWLRAKKDADRQGGLDAPKGCAEHCGGRAWLISPNNTPETEGKAVTHPETWVFAGDSVVRAKLY